VKDYSAAQRAGLQPGDIILEVNRTKVTSVKPRGRKPWCRAP
ncbi:MAG: PDZ domain-containing protein, partial [Pseudomonas sp.]|nr:PDZ domain-containing protein [Pseudomonas sp.]